MRTPYYPDRPGFVRGSDTSYQAADSLDEDRLGALRQMIYSYIKRHPKGATCDEIEVALDMRHQTASARLRELQLGGLVFTTDECRLTRAKRNAHVYRIKQRAVAA
jgi:hypothetical protein